MFIISLNTNLWKMRPLSLIRRILIVKKTLAILKTIYQATVLPITIEIINKPIN